MAASRDLKREHEKFICDELFRVLGIGGEFIRMGDDRGEPDVIYRVQDNTVGIEVGTAYYDETDARQEWTLARGERAFPAEGFEPRAAGVLLNPDDLICRKVQHEIDDKCGKQYGGADEIWLCVEQRAPLSDAQSVSACAKQLRISKGDRFTKIYIFYLASLNDGGAYTAVRIR